MSGSMTCVPIVTHSELTPDPHLPSYQLGSFTTMSSMMWNMTRVTVREGEERLLARELGMLSKLAHPQLLILMGHCPPTGREDLKLVFEPVVMGSLYHHLYTKEQAVTVLSAVDILLQVTDGMLYLAGRGLVHRAVTSHAVQLTSRGVAKLGQLEMTVREGVLVGRPDDTGRQSLYNWLSPEVLVQVDCVARQASDVYSLCCVMWEMCTGQVPWGDRRSKEIVSIVREGNVIRLDREKLPRLLYRVMKQGLIWDVEERDLDLGEVRDMLLMTREQEEEADKLKCFPKSALQLFSSSAIQKDIRRYLCNTNRCYNTPDQDTGSESDCSELETEEDHLLRADYLLRTDCLIRDDHLLKADPLSRFSHLSRADNMSRPYHMGRADHLHRANHLNSTDHLNIADHMTRADHMTSADHMISSYHMTRADHMTRVNPLNRVDLKNADHPYKVNHSKRPDFNYRNYPQCMDDRLRSDKVNSTENLYNYSRDINFNRNPVHKSQPGHTRYSQGRCRKPTEQPLSTSISYCSLAVPSSSIPPQSFDKEKTNKDNVLIPPAYRRRSCPLERREAVLGCLGGSGGGKEDLGDKNVFGATRLMKRSRPIVPESKGRSLFARSKETNLKCLDKEENLRKTMYQENNVSQKVVHSENRRFGKVTGGVAVDNNSVVQLKEKQKQSKFLVERMESLQMKTYAEKNMDTREKFKTAKDFFEFLSDDAKLDASSKDAFFTPMASPGQATRSSSTPTKSTPTCGKPGAPAGTFLKFWTSPPGAPVPATSECVPLSGTVKSTVCRYQAGRQKTDNQPSVSTNQQPSVCTHQPSISTHLPIVSIHQPGVSIQQLSVSSHQTSVNPHQQSYISTGQYQSANSTQSTSQSVKLKEFALSASSSLFQSVVHSLPPPFTSTQSTQTYFPTPALSQSTPLASHHQAISSTLSPLFCSPLLPSHLGASSRRGLAVNEFSSLDISRMEDPFVIKTSTQMDKKQQGVDFSNPDGRQSTFSAAMNQAGQDNSWSASEKTNTSGQFDTCTEYDTFAANDGQLSIKKPNAVTFNSSVEEFTTSIVSLMTDSGPRDGSSHSHSLSSSMGLHTVSETEDLYCDDELHPSLDLDPNMQLLTVTNISNNNWEEEQFNTAELGLTKEESVSIDITEFASGIGDEGVEDNISYKVFNKSEDLEITYDHDSNDVNNNNHIQDITGEVLTETEIEMSCEEVTKYESVVEETVWAGGDEGKFEDEDENYLNSQENSDSASTSDEVSGKETDDIETNEVVDEDDCGDGNFDNKRTEEVNDLMAKKVEDVLNPVETEWNEDNEAELKGDVDNEDKEDADTEHKDYVDTKWKEGDECIARWEEDGCWYKSVVEGVTEGTAVVTFLDFGNSAYCSVDLLKDKDTNIGCDGQLEVEEPQGEEWE